MALDIKNTQAAAVKAWIAVCILSFLGVFFGFAIFGSWGGFAGMIIMISATLFLTSIICIIMFQKRKNAVDSAINHGKYIAHWRYPEDEWAAFLRQEHEFRKTEKKGIFFFLTAITVPIFLVFMVVIDDGKLAMFLVMLGLIAMYAFMGLLLPRIVPLLKKGREADILILGKGVLLDGTFHTWDTPLSRLEGVKLRSSPYEHIVIVYSFVDRLGRRDYTVNIPVKKNAEVSGGSVVKALEDANQKPGQKPRKKQFR